MGSMHFFLEFEKIPRTTAQQNRFAVVSGKIRKYDDRKLEETKSAYRKQLRLHKPISPIDKPVRLVVVYHFERPRSVGKGMVYKVTRPDLDNLVKALKDCMTKEGYWLDDSQVVELFMSKVYAKGKVGIEVLIRELDLNKLSNDFVFGKLLVLCNS